MSLYTPKQLEIIGDSNLFKPRILIAEGAKRSGKTVQNNDIWLSIVGAKAFRGLRYIMVGNTLGTLKRNVIVELERRFKFKAVFNDCNEFLFLGNIMCCFGGGNADSYKTIQGFEAHGAYINEGCLIHEKTFREVLARCSAPDARIIVDSNPDHPNHYLKTDFIDKSGKRLASGKLDILSYKFTIWDNAKSNGGFLNDDYVESFVSNLPVGMWRKRDAEGLWVAAQGVIYDMFNEDVHIVKYKDVPLCDEYNISCDYGTQNPCTFGLYGYQRIFQKHYKVAEYYYSGREQGKQKTDSDYSADMKKFIEDSKQVVQNIIVDPSATSFIAQLKKDGMRVRLANNEVMPGIKNVMTQLHNQNYYISDICRNTKREYGIYSWNPKILDRDEPLKENDHTLDADRYYFQTLFPIRERIGTVAKNMGW